MEEVGKSEPENVHCVTLIGAMENPCGGERGRPESPYCSSISRVHSVSLSRHNPPKSSQHPSNITDMILKGFAKHENVIKDRMLVGTPALLLVAAVGLDLWMVSLIWETSAFKSFNSTIDSLSASTAIPRGECQCHFVAA
ncbi:unnamed protein product [Gadus morhua 'NCC']